MKCICITGKRNMNCICITEKKTLFILGGQNNTAHVTFTPLPLNGSGHQGIPYNYQGVGVGAFGRD